MGVMAFLVDVIVEKLVEWKWEFTQHLLDGGSTFWGGICYISISVLYSFTAAMLTIYVGPGAMGSGIAELMGYFNGVHIPNMIGVRTLIVKVLGTSLGVSASLAIGKEGPLAHIGGCVGHLVPYLPFDFMKYFQNEDFKR